MRGFDCAAVKHVRRGNKAAAADSGKWWGAGQSDKTGAPAGLRAPEGKRVTSSQTCVCACMCVCTCVCVCVHGYLCLCEGAKGRLGRHGALEGAQSMTQLRRPLGTGNCLL